MTPTVDEMERLVTLLDERVSEILKRLDVIEKHSETMRGRSNTILVGICVSLVLLVINVIVEKL